MKHPDNFIAVYECVECGEEMEMYNCHLEFITMPCEGCEDLARYYPTKVIHKSMNWDRIELDDGTVYDVDDPYWVKPD